MDRCSRRREVLDRCNLISRILRSGKSSSKDLSLSRCCQALEELESKIGGRCICAGNFFVLGEVITVVISCRAHKAKYGLQ